MRSGPGEYMGMSYENSNPEKETEQSLLNEITLGHVDFGEVQALGLTAKDFSTETYRLLYKAMKRLHDRNEPIDPLAVYNELEGVERPDGGAWSQCIANTLGTSIPLDDVAFHVNQLKQASHNRQLSEAAYRLYEAAERGDSERVRGLIEKIAELQSRDTGTGSRLKPISVADLPDIEIPDPLWAGLIYPGCVIQLNGEPGAGKSTIAYNLAALGAQGRDFVGESFPRPVKTLFVDLETPSWLRRPKIEAICEELPKDFELLPDLNLTRDIDELIRLCKVKSYDLIILDTQSKVFAMENENDNSEANLKAKLLDRLKLETGAAIILVHHTSKGGEGKDVYRGRGASAIAGSVDVVCNLEALDQDTVKLSVAKPRIPCKFRSLTLRKAGNDRFTRVESEEGNTGIELFRIQDFLIDLLSSARERLTPEILELAKEAGFAKRTTELALKRLREAGRITQIRRGAYALSGELIGEIEEPEDYPEVLNL
jgi:RecA/RadA recombinase